MKYVFYLAVTIFSLKSAAQTGIPVSQMTHCDNQVKSFLATYGIPGATFVMSKNGKIVYMRSFGFSDKAKTISTQPNNLFRIASLSKPITSIAIMKMMQDGLLSMSSKVFGPGGLLQNHPVIKTATIGDNRIYNITVQQLLEHSAGWNSAINCNPSPAFPYPWNINGCDPISFPLRVTNQLGTPNPVTEDDICKYMLQQGLNFIPGTQYRYSNVGYLYLGEIIEQLSGMSYEDYVKTTILAPLGIYDMHIAKNLLSEKMEREVEYTSTEGNSMSVYGTGMQLPWEYGGMNLNAMDAHGGWIATARDLVTLLNAIDGFATKPDILSAASINIMTAPAATSAGYAKGWQVNALNNWWHSGALPGTATIMARTSGQYTWAVLLNRRGVNNAFWAAFDNLPWTCMSNTTTWPTHDLMLVPTQNAANISFSNVTATTVTVNWAAGNGANRLLVARPQLATEAFPLDGTGYTANSDFSMANAVGTNNKIVYNGTGNSATITGLTPATNYTFRVMEYNKNIETGNNALYLLGNNPQASLVTLFTLPLQLVSFVATKVPNIIKLNWTTSQEINTSYFSVQKSLDGNTFAEVGTVKAKQNSFTASQYKYQDVLNQQNATTLYYRLQMFDKDGSFTYSPVARVNLQSVVKYTLSPNPAKGMVRVKVNNIRLIEVLDITGKTMLVKHYSAGANPEFNVAHLAKGIYVIKITDMGGNRISERLLLE